MLRARNLQRQSLCNTRIDNSQLIPAKVQPLQRQNDLKPTIQMMKHVAAEIDAPHVRNVLNSGRYLLAPIN
jgi:hypothetical protein